MARNGKTYLCNECGARYPRWSGRCPNCSEWDSLIEIQSEKGGSGRAASSLDSQQALAVRLSEVQATRAARIRTGSPELDRVLGGGILFGSAVLLAGDPGVGKSTVLLQALGHIAEQGGSVLYVSCEESLAQVRIRGRRVGLHDRPVLVSDETSLQGILHVIQSSELAVVAVDSIQRVQADGLDSPPGSVRQVSTAATALVEACKKAGCALVLVGHVTKAGAIAGPHTLEHLVDTVLYFESERFQSLRILRAVKNRFGAVDEIGVFEMTPSGLCEVEDPSGLFLAERDASASGSVVMPSVEGTRALLVEVQALVSPGAYGTPERKATGLDRRRFSMMMSVIERQIGLDLGKCDAFVNVAGGVRVLEPAADLPMVLALASSYLNRAFFPDAIAVGEVGLGGEVRGTSRVDERLKEAAKLGFRRAVVPASNAPAAAHTGLQVEPVRNLSQAVALLRGQEGGGGAPESG
jgi:DNA repair protein RadA/Sms